MYYTFDSYGWFSGVSENKTDRSTQIAPSNQSVSNTAGGLRANFTGYVWIDVVYVAPPLQTTPVPKVVSRAQFILALLQLDLLGEVEAAIAAADRATQINYKERLEFERGYPLIATMAAVLGKTDAEIDGLFVLAATL